MDNSTEQLAAFEIDLSLPNSQLKLSDSAKAVRQEYRDHSRWKRLSCRRVSVYSEHDRGTVYIVDVGGIVDFDWTWEGAVAFKPKSIDDYAMLSDFALENTVHDDEIVWAGEILQVDEQNGCLFLSVESPESIPTAGSFFVRPFEFLAVLDSVYNDPSFANQQNLLPARLEASKGGVHPTIRSKGTVGLEQLQPWWNHSWSVLWGPPGTGKTFSTGQQVASVVRDDSNERILVVSTTNRATDAVALSIGNASMQITPHQLDDGQLLRIGKGASYQAFQNNNLITMLKGTESDALSAIDELGRQLKRSEMMEEKALLRKQIAEFRTGDVDQASRVFLDPDVKVVVATAFKATSYLKNETVKTILAKGKAPFTTIFIDEAGLMSRAAIAALSLLAAKRVVLVGDSKQLAPISRISRVLPSRQKTWLASSGLTHLEELEDTPAAIHVLSEQRRMHPAVCEVVSDYQYGGCLKTAKERKTQISNLANEIAQFSRAVWYVLDADAKTLSSIRAERGPGNRSWIRKATLPVLQKLLSTKSIQDSNGLFISPYKAQAQTVSKQFGKWKLDRWEASTVHSQQGAEADIVLFDTVNAGNCNWPVEEWKRLVNVALSRAREAVIVLASRSEMEEPYLRPLIPALRPGVIQKTKTGYQWKTVDLNSVAETKVRYSSHPGRGKKPKQNSLGNQIDERRQMQPVLSKEQQRLSDLELDGKPRLVRGVAGSGKSYVLCNWLTKTVRRTGSNQEIWAVYANRSLHQMLRQSIESSWEDLNKDELFKQTPFPWERVSLLHIKDVLAGLLPNVSLSQQQFEFNYDRAAEEFLNRRNTDDLIPQCAALFIDEAQDLGPSTLRLLLSLVTQSDRDDPNSRSAHIFYDNAQNIYGRKTPTWSEFGLDMRGRSTIMRESFRSTKPITELAVNVLNKLSEDNLRADQKELIDIGLVEKTKRNGENWLTVNYNQVHGPAPIFQGFHSRRDEIARIAKHIQYLTQEEGIQPKDICVIYNGKKLLADLERLLNPAMAKIGIEVSVQKNRSFERHANTLVVTTSHSYKGYESEVIIIPGVDQFATGANEILANNLYVAMTRARSLLAVYGTRDGSTSANKICNTIERCIGLLNSKPFCDNEMYDGVDS